MKKDKIRNSIKLDKKLPTLKSLTALLIAIVISISVVFVLYRAYVVFLEDKQEQLRDKVKNDYAVQVEKMELYNEIASEEQEMLEKAEVERDIYFPREESKREINPVFIELMKEYDNEDIVGFLNIEGTSISYPVVQSKDNSFYLTHDIYKNPVAAGWIFMDYENDVSIQDYNTIIYGHNQKADYMFHALRYYKDEDFFNEHRYITLNTLYENKTWEVFSFYRAKTSFYYIQVIFDELSDFVNLCNQMKEKSMYDTGVEVTETDKILTLSTCTGESADTRFVLNAKLIKSVDTSQMYKAPPEY